MPYNHLHESTRQYVNSPSIAGDYDAYFAGLDLFAFDTVVLDQWFDRPGRLIDLGCGTGRHLLQFARRNFDVVGVDLSPAMLAQARAKLTRANLSARLVQADFTDLVITDPESPVSPQNSSPEPIAQFARHSFDYALCMFSTLGLILGRENRLRCLQDIRQLLKPDGQFVLHVHNRPYNLWRHEGRWFLLTNWIKSRLGRAEPGDKFMKRYRGIPNMYIHVFSETEILNLLAESGFRPIEVLALNPSRTGALKQRFCRALLANGFIIRARPDKMYNRPTGQQKSQSPALTTQNLS